MIWVHPHGRAHAREAEPQGGRFIPTLVSETAAAYPEQVDVQLPPPDVVGIEVPVDSLDGTAKSLARAAQLAGYTIRATRALGPRLPRQRGQEVVRIGTLALAGVKGQWRFVATWNIRDGWDVTQHRPGWPDTPGNVQTLRDTFKAQTALNGDGPKAA